MVYIRLIGGSDSGAQPAWIAATGLLVQSARSESISKPDLGDTRRGLIQHSTSSCVCMT